MPLLYLQEAIDARAMFECLAVKEPWPPAWVHARIVLGKCVVTTAEATLVAILQSEATTNAKKKKLENAWNGSHKLADELKVNLRQQVQPVLFSQVMNLILGSLRL